MLSSRSSLLVCLAAVAAAACSGAAAFTPGELGSGGSGGATGTTTGNGGNGTTSSTTTSGSGTSTSSTTSAGGGSGGSGVGGNAAGGVGQGGAEPLDAGADASSDAGPMLVPVVYAHSPSTLYRLDPVTKAVTVVGDFVGCSSVIDIAINKTGAMYGTTFGGLYQINPSTAKCAEVALGSYPNSLSFVPAGTLDPKEEALVGYNGSTYVRIDPKTGAVSDVGNLGNQGYSSSGDIVSVIGGGTYLTVNGNNCSDCIVEVDPKTGALVNMIGPVGHSSVFGLAFWAGVAYGFDDAGELFQIDLSNGSSALIPIPGAPLGLQFWGAGSTTAAPVHE